VGLTLSQKADEVAGETRHPPNRKLRSVNLAVAAAAVAGVLSGKTANPERVVLLGRPLGIVIENLRTSANRECWTPSRRASLSGTASPLSVGQLKA